jgi:hypothetical protein
MSPEQEQGMSPEQEQGMSPEQEQEQQWGLMGCLRNTMPRPNYSMPRYEHTGMRVPI